MKRVGTTAGPSRLADLTTVSNVNSQCLVSMILHNSLPLLENPQNPLENKHDKDLQKTTAGRKLKAKTKTDKQTTRH